MTLQKYTNSGVDSTYLFLYIVQI